MPTPCEDIECAQQLFSFLKLGAGASPHSVEATLRVMHPILVGAKVMPQNSAASAANQGILPERNLPLGSILLDVHSWLGNAKALTSSAKTGHRIWLDILLAVTAANEKLAAGGEETRVFPYKDSNGNTVVVVGKAKKGANTILAPDMVSEADLLAAIRQI